jgi:N-acetyl sugar amidotransferase
MDTTVNGIQFDVNGVCNFCNSHDKLLEYYKQDEIIRKESFGKLIEQIKKTGKDQKYDCIVGISGGTDSTYTLYMAVKNGLRPLAVYFDNGWGSEIAVQNIKNATKKLNVDLFTYVVDWEEFRELQIAFLKASVPCVEVPTDVAISATLYNLAKKENVKYVLSGASFITEGTVPKDWSYIDGTYVKSVNKLFGKSKLISYPNLTIYQIFIYTFLNGIKQIPFTNFFYYDKNDARKILETELDWQYYGGHHYENIYSYWAFGWYTYHKFGIDKRKVSLSGPVRMGRLSKEVALKQISEPPPVNEDTTKYVIKKLGLSETEFEEIMNAPIKSFRDYKTSYNMILKFKFLIKFLTDRKILSPVVYEKFLGY